MCISDGDALKVGMEEKSQVCGEGRGGLREDVRKPEVLVG